VGKVQIKTLMRGNSSLRLHLDYNQERAQALERSRFRVLSLAPCTLEPLLCSDPHGEFTGLNCLIERESMEATAAAVGLSVEETEATLAKSRQLLHERRAQRPRPHLDDKVSSLHICCILTSSVLWHIALLCDAPADFPDIPASSLSCPNSHHWTLIKQF